MTTVKKQNKLFFYIKGYSARFRPHKRLEKKIMELQKSLTKQELETVEYRVDYYNKISEKINITHNGTKIKDLCHPKTPKSYYFDTYEYAKYFDQNLFIDYAFGDINTILDFPVITKSRPITGNNGNNILLNLDKARHFVSVEDTTPYSKKSNIMIGRCAVYQQHRYEFFDAHFGSKMVDLGQVNKKGGNIEWLKPKMSIEEHLKYKFILSLEGNDVATNLKWIMSSNSVVVMPIPKIETWYMEGILKPDVHYISVSEDYTDLENKLQYYLDHPKECQEIIDNAKNFRKGFNHKKIEDLIAFLVLKKYFDYIC